MIPLVVDSKEEIMFPLYCHLTSGRGWPVILQTRFTVDRKEGTNKSSNKTDGFAITEIKEKITKLQNINDLILLKASILLCMCFVSAHARDSESGPSCSKAD